MDERNFLQTCLSIWPAANATARSPREAAHYAAWAETAAARLKALDAAPPAPPKQEAPSV